MDALMEEKKKRFEAMYQEQYVKAVRYVTFKIGNQENAEDLVHEAFISCYKSIETYDEEKATMETWVMVAIKNRLKNYYRDRKETSDIDELAEFISDGRESESEQAVFLKECRDVLATVLQKLDEKDRQIVILSYFKNKTSKEIGIELGLSEGNVRVRLTRVLGKLKVYLNEMNWNGVE